MVARALVCIPVDDVQLARIAVGQSLAGPLQVFTVTDELLDTFGLQPADDEPAEYAALLLAGLWSLLQHGRRVVLTAQVPQNQLDAGAETANGGRCLDGLSAADVEAWFADEPGVPIAELAAKLAGLSLDQAWEQPSVQQLFREHELLWHSVVELRKD